MQPGQLFIKHVLLATPAIAGELNVANGQYVETLTIASDGNLTGEFDAIVTGPVHKGLHEAGVAFSGHAEFFANKADRSDVMMLATEGLRVALQPLTFLLRTWQSHHSGARGENHQYFT